MVTGIVPWPVYRNLRLLGPSICTAIAIDGMREWPLRGVDARASFHVDLVRVIASVSIDRPAIRIRRAYSVVTPVGNARSIPASIVFGHLTQPLLFAVIKRASRISCQRLLFYLKGHRPCRRSEFHYDRPSGNPIGWIGSAFAFTRPKHAGARGRDSRAGYDPRIAPIRIAHRDRGLAYRLRVDDGGFLHHGDRSRVSLVHIVDVVDPDVRGIIIVVIVVGNVSDVGDARIGYVDGLKIAPAATVIRDVRLPVAQRKPSHAAASADPDHQRGGIAGTQASGPGDPCPAFAQKDPAAIVEWSKAPRGIVHPSPAPGLDPYPVSIPVRGPIVPNRSGDPYRSIFRDYAPLSILVKIFISDNVRRDVAYR